jgi:hypothetical protein
MMRPVAIGLISIGSILSGCNAQEDAMTGAGQKSQGRYAGIGTFEPGRLWEQMAGTADPADPAAAKLEDDEQIIVVIDSHTGEVRQCGNHSGFCVTMDPWASATVRTGAPIKLKKHAADLAAEDQTSVEATEPVAKQAATAH